MTEDLAGNGLLVGRDRQATLGDVEDTGGGAAVIARVVQDPVGEPVTGEQLGGVVVGVDRQRQGARQARQVQGQGAPRQPRLGVGALEEVGEEGLDPLVDRGQAIVEAAAQLALALQERGDEVLLGVVHPLQGGQAEQGQTQVDGREKVGRRRGEWVGGAHCVHGSSVLP